MVDGGGGETPARPSGRCGSRRREPTAPATSTRFGEAPEVLLDGGVVTTRQIEGNDGARVTGGGTQEESGSGTAEVGMTGGPRLSAIAATASDEGRCWVVREAGLRLVDGAHTGCELGRQLCWAARLAVQGGLGREAKGAAADFKFWAQTKTGQNWV
jgi:hypothetical protein